MRGVVALLLLVFAVVSFAEGFYLRYGYKGVKSVIYQVRSSVIEEAEVLNLYNKAVRKDTLRIRQRITPSKDKKGFLIVTDILGGIKEYNGVTSEIRIKLNAHRMLMDYLGRVVFTSNTLNIESWEKMNFHFPNRKVKVGDSWKIEKILEAQNFQKFNGAKFVAEYKISGIKEFMGSKCAVIDGSFKILQTKRRKDLKFRVIGRTRMFFDLKRKFVVNQNTTAILTLKGYSNKTKNKKWIKVLDYTAKYSYTTRVIAVNK